MGQEDKSFLNLAGELAVASELNRRGVHAAVTYGTSKRADVFAMADSGDRLVRIEVKCSNKRKWLIGHSGASPPKTGSDRMRWVLVHVPPPPKGAPSSDVERGKTAPRFFVLTAAQLFDVFRHRADEWGARYRGRHGKEFTGRGVPNVSLADVERYEGAWDSILSLLNA